MPASPPLRIWLITVGEPLPLPDLRDRPLRTGLLASVLASRSHEVVWWTSTFDHVRKRGFVDGEPRLNVAPGVTLRFLQGRPYRANVSLSRLVNHAQIARRFAQLAPGEARPDLILCSFPTIELSREAVTFGARAGVPVLLDVRDLWPDIFLGTLPAWLRPVERMLLGSLFRQTATAFRACDGVFAVSDGYLEWGLAKAGRARGGQDAVYPLGYQLSASSAADSEALSQRIVQAGLDLRAPLVTFVGSFGRTYDLRTVIEAARLSQSGASFVLCGAGEREAEWRALAEGVPNLVFTGWLSGGELTALLRRSAIALAAYADKAPQGMPNKVIEYLAAGIPTLCSLEGESRRLLESSGSGAYFAAGDGAGLARQVDELVADDARRARMSAAATDLFNRHFAASSVYGKMADQLESIARGAVKELKRA